ncbi:MAG: BACON domain-containing protein [Prolixibacteraceae bacterium]|jgi:hypothetical protein|nr:BACON domain-containing protein [Prolixibacteraceae bacterium]
MKKYSFFKLKNAGIMLFSFFIVSTGLFLSCEEEETSGEPYFAIEGDPTGLSVSTATKTQAYVVRSNRPWQVVKQSEGDWVKAFPDEGKDDGIFKIIVEENATFFPRTMNFAFIVDGEEQPVLFRVDQEKSNPYLIVAGIEAGMNINQIAQEVKINVKANVVYTYNSDAPWLTFKNANSGSLGTDLIFDATANEALNSRVANVAFTCAAFPELNVTLAITQEGKSEGTIILFEDFSWLAYGSPIFYTTTGETRMDLWSEAEKAKGWTSTPNPGSSGQPLVYARQGFIKLGKTGYGGDLISPKLTGLTEPTNLLVKFKAVPYMTAAGTKDDTDLYVSIVGPGTISQSKFIIDNWPNYGNDPTCTAIWEDIATERTFTITGATSETQINFLGGALNLVGVGAGKNRIFLDDIKVLIPN